MPGRLLLVSSGFLHPGILARNAVSKLLETGEGLSLARAESLEALSARRLKGYLPGDRYDAVVLHGHYQRISVEALDALAAFIDGGGGFLVLHNSSASFPDQPEFDEIIGGRFWLEEDLRLVELHPEHHDDPLLGETSDIAIPDRPCLHACDPQNRVHYRAHLGERLEPVIWSRIYGSGRVFYCGPGHTPESLRHPAISKIILTAARWVSSCFTDTSYHTQPSLLDSEE